MHWIQDLEWRARCSNKSSMRARVCVPTVALAVLLAACGQGSATANDNRARGGDHTGSEAIGRSGTTEGMTVEGTTVETTVGGESGTAGGSRATGACPARFGDPGPTCQDRDTPVSCGYPEGSCSCETGTWCGGAAPPPMPLAWHCRPQRSPCAAEGSPCTEPSAPCTFDDCGFHGMRCVGGVWRSYMTPLPP